MKLGMGIPNVLTVLRIGLIPVLVALFYLPFAHAHIITAFVFVLACLTDWLDGYLARRWQQSSSFGAFFDPVADKLLVSSSLLLLVGTADLHFITLPAMVIVGREIVISALREWMAEIGRRASIAVGYVGKIKTAMQMIAIACLLCSPNQTTWLGLGGTVLLYLAAILTIWSMVEYLKIAWPELTKKNELIG